MKKLTLKELKQHFKNAKDIKSVCGTFEQNININNIYLEEDCSWCTEKGNILFVDGEYAEIISYKEEIKQEGLRYNENKERWSLVDFEALKPMVKVLEYGAKKYDDHNWKKGLKTTEVAESLLRHLTAYLNGEDNDKETNLPHTGHILCNAMFLSYMHEFKKEFDTRYKKPCCGNWDELGNCKCKNNG